MAAIRSVKGSIDQSVSIVCHCMPHDQVLSMGVPDHEAII